MEGAPERIEGYPARQIAINAGEAAR